MRHNPSQPAGFEIPETRNETVDDRESARLPFATDIDVQRASFGLYDGYYVLGFHLLINGRWSIAFERANVDGNLVDEIDSTIRRPDSERLEADNLTFTR